mgnify:CR=1 FL=1
MDMNITIDTSINNYTTITQDMYTEVNDTRERLSRWTLDTSEAGVRAALIELGWTPPPGSDWVDWEDAGIKAMVAKLQEARK